MWVFAVFVTTVFLAYANGANDNFKGVATLFGSQTTNYKVAIWWATATTFAGSICSVILASALLKNFSGKGLVPDAIADTSSFHIAVALGAALTVILATVTGFPISTTHGITGALTGAGLAAIGMELNFAALGKSFFIPLLASPLIAIVLGIILYSLLHYLRMALKIEKAWCICVGNQQKLIPIAISSDSNNLAMSTTPNLAIDTKENCSQRYVGNFWGIDSHKIVDTCHFLSAGAVSFARGLNDTPKIVALLLTVTAFSIRGGMLAVGLGMAIGGLLNARKVAMTVSNKITTLNPGKGLAANVVTGFLVIFASRMGVPVSTTHVSVGSIFGVGVISKTAHIGMFSKVLSSWFLTLPIAATLSSITYLLLPK
ncbi:inorganic phosphate transporter [Waterburya agarophytonicola K14]|uniref:Phosphate transporter n=1 Tax=Waterburya agarophytonicola KI4 TaxID=2874699 RepID=A0A964BW35_9CYAN|nr:inorganic phosphate transporter [Waterburya agarophytonicola]MCC0179646.1 inorganic phosphate transporter [Waterburya agarophytonicola KI4]